MSPKLRHYGGRALRWAGFVVLALVTFLLVLQATFPYGRVKDKLIEALASKYDVTIASVDRGLLPGRMIFKSVMLTSKPSKPDEVPTTYFIDRLEVDLGMLALVRGTIAIDIDAKIGSGSLVGSIALEMNGTPRHIAITGKGVPAENLPLKGYVPVPLSGKIDLGMDMSIVSTKGKIDWPKTEGVITLACATGCDVGDGKTKVKLAAKNKRNEAFAGDGIELAMLHLNHLDGRFEVDKGLAKLTKFDVDSDDVKLEVDFQMKLDSTFNDSAVAGCLRFAGTDALLKRKGEIYQKTYTALQTTGGPLGPDKLYHIQLDGKFRDIKRLPHVCGGEAGAHGAGADEEFSGAGDDRKPNLTLPEEGAVAVPPIEPPPPPVAEPVTFDAGVPDAVPAATGTPTGAPTGDIPPAGSGAAPNMMPGNGEAIPPPPPPGTEGAAQPEPPPSGQPEPPPPVEH